jgi:hypothetical protein
MDDFENNQLLGRMMECSDIEMAIKSGQLSKLEDVLESVQKRASAINETLNKKGVFKGTKSANN